MKTYYIKTPTVGGNKTLAAASGPDNAKHLLAIHKWFNPLAFIDAEKGKAKINGCLFAKGH